MIHIICPSRYKFDKKLLKEYISDFLEKQNISPSAILNIVFVGKRKMTAIALEYKQERVALPVLAFSYKEDKLEENILGEVIMCYPQIILLAAERGKKVQDMLNQMAEHGVRNILQH